MKKQIITLIIAVTAIMATFLAGFFYGRKLSSSPIQVNTFVYEKPSGAADSASVSSPAVSVNINTATEAELTVLPGIGEVLAKRIVEYRTQHGPFSAVEMLLKVEGISQKRYDAIKDYITTGD